MQRKPTVTFFRVEHRVPYDNARGGHRAIMAARFAHDQTGGALNARHCQSCGSRVLVLHKVKGRELCDGCAFGRPR